MDLSLGSVVVLLGFAALMCSAGAGVLISVSEARRRRFDGRMAAIGSLAAGARMPGVMRRIARAAPKAATPLERLAKLFGIDLQRVKYYSVHPAIILIGTFVAARALCYALSLVLGGFAVLVMVIAWPGLNTIVVGVIEGRRASKLLSQLPDALAMIVRSVRVGVPVTESLSTVARESQEPTASEFARMEAEVAIGGPLDASLKAMAERSGVPEYKFFATTLTLQAQTGGALSETLEGLADVIRRRLALRAKGQAMAAQAKTSAMVLGFMPFISGGGMFFLNPTYIGLLFTDPMGQQMLGIGIAMLSVGGLIMWSMINRSLA